MKAGRTERDRVYVEKHQIEGYRKMAGIGTARRRKAVGADAPPFRDLKDVFLMAACLGVRARQRTPLRDKQELTRTSYFEKETDLAVLRAIAIAETQGVQVLEDEDAIFTIAEEYANTGYAELESRVLGAGRPLVSLTDLLLGEYADESAGDS